MATFIIATRNRHKVEEIRAILGAQHAYATLNDFPGAPVAVEDEPTFAGNAQKKAACLATWLPCPAQSADARLVLADDSGLEVDALAGAPGVHSARFAALDGADAKAAGNSPDAANNAKLLRLLEPVPLAQRTARFRCVLALARANGWASHADGQLFDGACEGHIAFHPAGTGGFGYDPLFIPAGRSESFAELGEVIKNQMSHRAAALHKLKAWLAHHLL